MTASLILFDAGETLVRPEPSFGAALHAILAGLGHELDAAEVDRLSHDALAGEVARAAADGRTWSTSGEESRAFWTGVYTSLLEAAGVADATGRLPHAIYDEFTRPHRYALFPDAMPALRELKSHGYRLGVISNWEAWLAGLLETLGVSPLLDVAVISGAEGVEKPDPRIFRLALDRAGADAAEAVYVGDSPSHDVEPAMALGMRAVLIDRRDRHPGVHRPTIASLGQLRAVL